MLWHCWLGDRKGIRPVKNWMLVCWWWFDWSFARLIAPVVTTTSIILCFNKHRLTQVHLENGHLNGERESKGLPVKADAKSKLSQSLRNLGQGLSLLGQGQGLTLRQEDVLTELTMSAISCEDLSCRCRWVTRSVAIFCLFCVRTTTLPSSDERASSSAACSGYVQRFKWIYRWYPGALA